MENQKIKCSLKKHEDIEAILYCQECKMYMCNKCQNYHSELFENKHHQYTLDKNINEIFTGLCKEKNHFNKLEYFCKTHNKLCCAECIINIKHKGNGYHKDCEICCIEKIKDEKKNKLESNINSLKELSNILKESINKLKIICEQINENKEKLKLNIQKIFTKLRNQLNDREDELLLEIDKKFEELYFKEDIIKKNEKLPNKIKDILDNTKINEDDWKDEKKLSSLINDCINIENNIKDIKIINENINKFESIDIENIKFIYGDNNINNFLEIFKSFGKISLDKKVEFKFKKCPNNINEKRKYSISGEKENIITKTGENYQWMGTICENILKENEIYKWKIKVLKTYDYNIMIGVAPIDFNISSTIYYNYGWYYYLFNSKFRSGPPYNYSKDTKLPIKSNEIEVILDMNQKTLKFIIGDKEDAYNNIPIDKPLSPAIFLYHINDSIEIE